MKTHSLVSITPLSMPRKSLIISIVLLMGLGFMLVGGWSSQAWADEKNDLQIDHIVMGYRYWQDGRYQIIINTKTPERSDWSCEFDVAKENYKDFLAAAFVAYTSGKKVRIDYSMNTQPYGCRINYLTLLPH